MIADRPMPTGRSTGGRVLHRGGDPTMPESYRPMLGFMLVGAQKCGTTALAHFLSQHPEIEMASPKEVHLFDSSTYSRGWSGQRIDEHYRPHFEQRAGAAIRGEATPIYMFLPGIASELKRYNPDLKLIVLLRDPVERAISHYYMEKNRDCGAPASVAGLGERTVQAAPLQGCVRGRLRDAKVMLVPPARSLQPSVARPLPVLRLRTGC